MNQSTRNALIQWASSITGLTVVWADQASPRPPLPYVVLKMRGTYRDLGLDELRHTDTEGEFNLVGQRRLVLSVSVYGLDIHATHQKAESLNNSLCLPSVQSSLYSEGLSVSDPGDIQNLTSFLDTRFQAVFTFDASFLYATSTHDILGSIRDVELTGNIEREGE